ncbi:MAG: hypothetical protein COS14_08890 [Bacteroidetes bacterium CG02_land_8_20_14_3_00_31_25]|nr:hypothetical protein [Bacteroidota bacterium]PIV58576.1 MAG: hypothetical protein COS14_08890 [Bacteroidetes bacterium CG02_land_8_20_14_3_00_31_25]PIX34446.1 MAG: hypothetical protein COZ59_07855 [Bacteroidetes bacterium CG_4_8_14_3_um_filter_31_14]PIY06306.1 MAG: hypothetical protein COZ21_02980 [Bacteroidetes bacterium CG_4_10_14_3_um_filter_31_20]
MPALNPIQLEVLKLFRFTKNEEDLLELKTVLINYLSQKAVSEADKTFDENGFTINDIEQWRKEHLRKRK